MSVLIVNQEREERERVKMEVILGGSKHGLVEKVLMISLLGWAWLTSPACEFSFWFGLV